MPVRECYLPQQAPIPLVAIASAGALPPVWCKLEFLNPSGSIKDRIAHHILSKALNRGELVAGDTLVGLLQSVRDHGCRVLPVAARPVRGDSLGDVECCSFSSRVPGVVEGLSELYRPPGILRSESEVDATRVLRDGQARAVADVTDSCSETTYGLGRGVERKPQESPFFVYETSPRPQTTALLCERLL